MWATIRTVKTLLAVGLSIDERGALRDLLPARRWAVRAAGGWTRVFERLRECPYDAVLCESSLADGDWKDVLAELLLCSSPPPLIVTSRLADAYLWTEVLDAGGFDVVPSPWEERELIRVLERAAADTSADESWQPPALIPAGSFYDGDA